jgi:tRNA 2-selenouridine synthase
MVLGKRIDIAGFLELLHSGVPAFDVRTPAEYESGHIPGVNNLPLFSNEERVVVGTSYKQKGREQALLEGLEFVGPKMRTMVEEVIKASGSPPGKVLVHCWRGGMRSQSVAWLLELYGYETLTLEKGYKGFRHWVLGQLDDVPPLNVIGGPTGAGKTDILDVLKEDGEPVIDLEGLANHRGSAFGSLLLGAQPTQEHFENLLAFELARVRVQGLPVWIEDESRMVGYVQVPNRVYEAIRASQVLFLEVPFESRVERLVEVYGDASPELLKDSFDRIQTRLGGLKHKEAHDALEKGDLHEAAAIALTYYDRAYAKGLGRRDPELVMRVEVNGGAREMANQIRAFKARDIA